MCGYSAQLKAIIENRLKVVQVPGDISIAVSKIVDDFYTLFCNEPSLAGIWSAVQANSVLRECDIEDTRNLARFIAEQIARVVPHVSMEQLYEICWYAAWTVPASIRIAFFTQGKEGNSIIKQTKKNIVRSFDELF